jgi:hypothetical protein
MEHRIVQVRAWCFFESLEMRASDPNELACCYASWPWVLDFVSCPNWISDNDRNSKQKPSVTTWLHCHDPMYSGLHIYISWIATLRAISISTHSYPPCHHSIHDKKVAYNMLYIYIYIYIFECEIEKGPLDGWDGDLSLTIMLRTKSIERKFKKKYIFLILIVIIHLWSCKKKKKRQT